MNAIEKFWIEIGALITTKFGNGHPKDWDKFKIDVFLRGFQKKLESVCQEDSQKAALCGASRSANGKMQSPGLSYHSFRRIFITKESMGNRTTREMFAIYFGFDSVDDFLTRKRIDGDPDPEQTEFQKMSSDTVVKGNFKFYPLLLIAFAVVIGGIIVFIQNHFEFSNPFFGSTIKPSVTKYMLVRHDGGIAIVNLKKKTLTELVRNNPNIIGFDFDPKTRMLFWANVNPEYRCISRVQLNNTFTGIESGTLNTRLTQRMGFPTGVVLDTEKKLIYCADLINAIIVVYDYDGIVQSPSLIGKIEGKLSSVELDAKQQVLYWTDIKNNKIGRISLADGRKDPDFITATDSFPDGLSIDTLHDKIYWASYPSNKIGWAFIPEPTPNLVPVNESPAAIEVDPTDGTLFYSLRDGEHFREVSLNEEKVTLSFSNKNIFPAGGTSPGVLKIFQVKN